MSFGCSKQSSGSYAYTNDPKYHRKTKHVDTMNTKYNFAKDIIEKEVILKYMLAHSMVADPFTEPIPRDIFIDHVRSLGLHRI